MDKSVVEERGPAQFRHAVIRSVIGFGIVIAGILLFRVRQDWHASIHGGLLSGWNFGGLTPFRLAMSTVNASQSRSWQGTAVACFGSVIGAIQYELTALAVALLMSNSYPNVPENFFLSALPSFAGVAVALPIMLCTAIATTRRAGRIIL